MKPAALVLGLLLCACGAQVDETHADSSELTCSMLDGGAILDRGGWELVTCNRMPAPGELSNPGSECEEVEHSVYFCRWFFPKQA
ncbi:MAG TPA: hypothetical protein VG734_25690 [Lacunisphaera sp.]|nr:hypothetical protein [Lacunisphaera sp.]